MLVIEIFFLVFYVISLLILPKCNYKKKKKKSIMLIQV